MKKSNQFAIKFLYSIPFFIFGLFLFSVPQTEAAYYNIMYRGTSFTVNSLEIDVEWDALGWGNIDQPTSPYFQVNSSKFYKTSSYYDWIARNYVPGSGSTPGGPFYSIEWSWPPTKQSLTTNLSVGLNTFSMFSNNYGYDACGCFGMSTYHDFGVDEPEERYAFLPVDGVYAKITFDNDSSKVLYTDTSWSGTGGVIDLGGCDNSINNAGWPSFQYTGYIQTRPTGTCAYTQVSKTINVQSIPDPIAVDLKIDGSNGPLTIGPNTSHTLSWNTSGNPSSCYASGGWSGYKSSLGGSQSTGPIASSRSYTLTCSRSGQPNVSDTVTVNVSAPTCSIILGVSPAGSGTASITSGNATYVCNDGNLSAATAAANSGYDFKGWDTTGDLIADYPSALNPFNLTHDRSWNNTALFAVNQPPTITTDKTLVEHFAGGNGTFELTVTDPEDVGVNVNWQWDSYCGGYNLTSPPGGAVLSSPYNRTVRGSGFSVDVDCPNGAELTISASDSAGNSAAPKVVYFVEVSPSPPPPPPPTVDLKVNGSDNPADVQAPADLTVSWTTTNSDQIIRCDGTGSGWSGEKAKTGGNDSGGNLDNISAGAYTYSISCEISGGFIEDEVNINVLNNAPSADSLSAVQSGSEQNCSSAPSVVFSWTYSDSNGDAESRFQFQADDKANFSDCDAGLNCDVNKDYPDLNNPNPSQNSQNIIVAVNPVMGSQLAYNKTYYWRVKVWDGNGAQSNWFSGASFDTPLHQYPTVNFDWNPLNPSVNEKTHFTDLSEAFDAVINFWSWLIPDADYLESTDSSSQYPVVKFNSISGKSISLTVTDSSGYTCSVSKILIPRLPLPGWKEVAPE